jgi:hypothetical protein
LHAATAKQMRARRALLSVESTLDCSFHVFRVQQRSDLPGKPACIIL